MESSEATLAEADYFCPGEGAGGPRRVSAFRGEVRAFEAKVSGFSRYCARACPLVGPQWGPPAVVSLDEAPQPRNRRTPSWAVVGGAETLGMAEAPVANIVRRVEYGVEGKVVPRDEVLSVVDPMKSPPLLWHAVACTEGWLVVHGGVCGTSYSGRVLGIPLEPATRLPAAPPRCVTASDYRAGHTAVCTARDEVTLFGGWCLGINKRTLKIEEVLTNDVSVLSTTTWTVSSVQKDGGGGPCPRADHTAVEWRGGMVVFGGVGTSGLLGDCWRFERGRWTHVGTSTPRAGHAAVVVGRHMLVVGGGPPAAMDLEDGSWHDVYAPFASRVGHTLVVLPPPRQPRRRSAAHHTSTKTTSLSSSYTSLLSSTSENNKCYASVLVLGGREGEERLLTSPLRRPPPTRTVCSPPQVLLLYPVETYRPATNKSRNHRLYRVQLQAKEATQELMKKKAAPKPAKPWKTLQWMRRAYHNASSQSPAVTYSTLSSTFFSMKGHTACEVDMVNAVMARHPDDSTVSWEELRRELEGELVTRSAHRMHYQAVERKKERERQAAELRLEHSKQLKREQRKLTREEVIALGNRLCHAELQYRTERREQLERAAYPVVRTVGPALPEFVNRFYYLPVAAQDRFRRLLEMSYDSPSDTGHVLTIPERLRMRAPPQQLFTTDEMKMAYTNLLWPVIPCGGPSKAAKRFASRREEQEAIRILHTNSRPRARRIERGERELRALFRWAKEKSGHVRGARKVLQAMGPRDLVLAGGERAAVVRELAMGLTWPERAEATKLMQAFHATKAPLVDDLGPPSDYCWNVAGFFTKGHPTLDDISLIYDRARKALLRDIPDVPSPDPPATIPSPPVLRFERPEFSDTSLFSPPTHWKGDLSNEEINEYSDILSHKEQTPPSEAWGRPRRVVDKLQKARKARLKRITRNRDGYGETIPLRMLDFSSSLEVSSPVRMNTT